MTNNPQFTPEIKGLLLGLAGVYAPALVPTAPESSAIEVPVFARRLASEGLLVLLLDKTPHDVGKIPLMAYNYAEGYKQLYMLLTNVLFPSLSQIKAFHYSYSLPTLMLVLQGEADPVMEILAGYISPYIVARQDYDNIFTLEMHSLMQRILDRLEASTIDAAIREELCKQGVTILHNILMQPLNELPLVPFDVEISSVLTQKVTGPLVKPASPQAAIKQNPVPPPLPPEPTSPDKPTRRHPSLRGASREFPSVGPRRPSPPDKD